MQSRIVAIALAALVLGADVSVSEDTIAPKKPQPRDVRKEATQAFGTIEPASAEQLAAPAVVLGRELFWDERLSADGNTACASCHAAAAWGGDARRFSLDARGGNTARNSQTVFNALLQPALRWTGDRRSGAHQAEKSLTGSMGFAAADAVVPLLKEVGYEAAFRAACSEDAEPVSPPPLHRGDRSLGGDAHHSGAVRSVSGRRRCRADREATDWPATVPRQRMRRLPCRTPARRRHDREVRRGQGLLDSHQVGWPRSRCCRGHQEGLRSIPVPRVDAPQLPQAGTILP